MIGVDHEVHAEDFEVVGEFLWVDASGTGSHDVGGDFLFLDV